MVPGQQETQPLTQHRFSSPAPRLEFYTIRTTVSQLLRTITHALKLLILVAFATVQLVPIVQSYREPMMKAAHLLISIRTSVARTIPPASGRLALTFQTRLCIAGTLSMVHNCFSTT